MPAIDMNDKTQDQFIRRVGALKPDSQRQWGTMSIDKMLAHLNRAFQMTFGEIEVKDESSFLLKYIAAPIFFSGLVPWPQGGKLKAPPIFLPDPEGGFEAERDRLIANIERFVEESAKTPGRKTLHPAFGEVTFKWSMRQHGMHTDHHLRQFGV